MFSTPSVVVIALVVLAVVFITRALVIVPQGFRYTVEYFGRYTNTLDPGLHFVVPFVQRVGARVDMRETVLDIPSQEVISRDNALIQVDGICFFQVIDAAASVYEVAELSRAVRNLVTTNLRTVMGSMDLDEILSERDSINARLLQVVDEATAAWGVKVTRVEIKDITPPQDLVMAMSRQMTAEREKRAAILEAEGKRQSEILKAEGEKQGAILQAEGRREAAYRDAEARERMAQAESRATLMVSKAIAEGDIQAVNYFVAQKYIEALSTIASAQNQKVIFMPLEAGSVIGALGGMNELLKTIKH
ncbi:SPFH domain-containing protein [Mangrovitalea sediminis]|uniref:SPFH domain-containing protein n=1 Tax=Mangrovitalea sediminis TaxID=1982043 RepID=UPI000BE5CEFB|nr:SPFH domain-containing protein [Mangrovitalea sediminis]